MIPLLPGRLRLFSLCWRLSAFVPALLLCCVFDMGCRPALTNPPVPAVPPSGSIAFRDESVTAVLLHKWGHPTVRGLNAIDTIGHGCAFLDYDADGNLDILLIADDHCILYRNRGNGTFTDVTDLAFPAAPRTPRLIGCTVADYDNDGLPDIFVTGYGRTILYHNEGNGTFRDVTAGSGLEARGPYDWTTSAAWADLDGTGRLDLYVCRYVRLTPRDIQLCRYPGLDGNSVMMACGPLNYAAQKGSLYRNIGGGRFRDVTAEAGLNVAHGNALGCMFCDLNFDGKPDLFIANDERQADLFLNLGGGRFRNIAVEAGVAYNANGGSPAGMGVDWADYDCDGRFDLLVADFASQPKSLFHNDIRNGGAPVFSQTGYSSGLGGATLRPLAFGAAFVDADNDGWADVALTNGHVASQVELTDTGQSYAQPTQLLRNVAGRFVDVSAGAGIDFSRKIVGRGIAVGDYDHDGREDLLIVDDEGKPLLLHNRSANANHAITLNCMRRNGRGYAVGALITVTALGRKHVAEVRASGSYLSTNSPQVHIGLADAAVIDSVAIRWPNGAQAEFKHVAADGFYTVSEGDAQLKRTGP